MLHVDSFATHQWHYLPGLHKEPAGTTCNDDDGLRVHLSGQNGTGRGRTPVCLAVIGLRLFRVNQSGQNGTDCRMPQCLAGDLELVVLRRIRVNQSGQNGMKWAECQSAWLGTRNDCAETYQSDPECHPVGEMYVVDRMPKGLARHLCLLCSGLTIVLRTTQRRIRIK